MRIAQVSSRLPPYPAGTGQVCYYTSRALAARGHEVHVFAASDGPTRLEHANSVVVHWLRPTLALGNASVLPQLVLTLRGFDVIHLHAPFISGAELAFLAARIHRTPLVVTYHNDLPHVGSWRDYVFRLATWTSRTLVFRHCTELLFLNEGHARTNDMRCLMVERKRAPRIQPNAVDVTAFSPTVDGSRVREELGITSDQPVVVFVGVLDRAHPGKGLSVLLEALRSLQELAPHLIVVGDGDQREQYRHKSVAMGLAENVHFVGAVNHERLPEFYRAGDLLALPSVEPEASPLVVLEALAAAVPVVASDSPGVRSMLPDLFPIVLTPPGDPCSLAKSLRALLQDPQLRQSMAAKGRLMIEECYTWGAAARRLELIYQGALGDPPRFGA